MDLADRRRRLRDRYETLIETYGSPLYVFYETDLRRNYRELRDALDAHYPDSRVHFAVKANFNLGVLSVLRDAGCAAEAYARCELTAADRAGFEPDDVLLTGINRRREDLERALELGVERFLVDNEAELTNVIEAASTTGQEARVLVRTNPALDVPTHPDVATATRETKFGLDLESGRAMAVARRASEAEGVDLAGVQLHLGSQIRGTEPYAVAARELLAFAADVRDDLGVEIDSLDLGGGFPIQYDEPVPSTDAIVETMGEAIREACDRHGLSRPRLLLEPGRRLVGTAGTLLGTVGSVKETPYATFAVLDVGTNAVSARWPHPMYSLSGGDEEREYHVAGPLCFSGDVFAEDVTLSHLDVGDVLAIDEIGAYSVAGASNTNAEPRPPIVLLREDGDASVVREPETCRHVLGLDRVPEDLA
jgi:diaminopimelate decarboxylase